MRRAKYSDSARRFVWQLLTSGTADVTTYAKDTASNGLPRVPQMYTMRKEFLSRPYRTAMPSEPLQGVFEIVRKMSSEIKTKSPPVISEIHENTIEDIKALNPQLAALMESHQDSSRVDEVNALKGLLEEELRSAHEGKQVNITKTALMKLKVNVLRGMLETVGGDTRGNKAAIVDRILGAIKEDFEQEKMQEVADYVGEGLIQRRKIFRLMRLKEKAQGKYNQPVSQEELETSLAEAASPNNIYSKAFSSPHEVAKLLVDARADDVVIIDVTGDRCSFTDYMVVASASSHQLVHMMASAVLYELKQRCKEVAPGVYPTIEGVDDPNPNWLVIDAGSIVVHVFHEDARSEYDLEGLWGRSDTVTRVAAPVSTHNLNTLRM